MYRERTGTISAALSDSRRPSSTRPALHPLSSVTHCARWWKVQTIPHKLSRMHWMARQGSNVIPGSSWCTTSLRLPWKHRLRLRRARANETATTPRHPRLRSEPTNTSGTRTKSHRADFHCQCSAADARLSAPSTRPTRTTERATSLSPSSAGRARASPK